MSPHRNVFSQHPLAQLAVAFAAGVWATHYFSLRMGFTLIGGLVCSALVVFFVLKKKLRVAGWALLFAIFFVGAVLALLERRADVERIVAQSTDDSLTLTGVLDGPPEFARNRLYLSLRVETGGRISILATFRNAASEQEYRSLQLRYGTRIRVKTTLDRTGNYRNPGVS